MRFRLCKLWLFKKFVVSLPSNWLIMAKKVLYILFFLCVQTHITFVSAQKNVPKHIYTVVIDAGHGGKDPGAVGAFTYEKTLNLGVALETGRMIKEAYPEVRVVFTRDSDVFLPLQARADTVNKYNADLFICVHTNSSESRQACGAETYILGTDKLEQNLDVAMRENAVIKLESDYETAYQGFDPNSIDSYIMFELMQNQYVDQSLQFASMVQKRFVEKLPVTDRGVRQAAYWVLLKSACPSVLIEMGFISNPKEEKYLASKEGQYNIALSLFESFCSFYHKPPKTSIKPVEATTTAKPQPEKATPAKESQKAPVPVVTPTIEKKDTIALVPAKTTTSPVVVSVEKANKDTIVAVKAEMKPDTISTKEENKSIEKQRDTIDISRPIYAVQVMAIKSPLKDETSLKGYKCEYFQKDGWYKYYLGATNDQQKAKQTLSQMKNIFPGCFITILPNSNQQ